MKYKLKPWDHQQKVIDACRDRDHYALFFDMGTGKSLTLVNILRQKCYQNGRVLRTIIFCPPVVRRQWLKEIDNSSHMVKDATVLEGSGKKRLELFEKNASTSGHIFITNYESMNMKPLYAAMSNWYPEFLCFDESHMLKGYNSKRSKLAHSLADLARHKFILTGTPILNDAMDIWSQYRVLDGGETFEKNFWAFRARYFYDKNAGMPKQKYFPDWRPRPNIEEEFNRKIYQKASRLLKKDCLDLPDFVRQKVEVELTPEQKKVYDSMAKDFVAYINDKAVVATIALTKGLRLQQIASGFYVTEDGDEVSFKKNPRLDAIKELVEPIAAAGHKIIIWSCFKQNNREIHKMLSTKYQCVLLVGGMTDKDRNETLERFNHGDAQICIANQQAGGTGVNLTAASYAIYNSRNFSLDADLQSEARNYRGGSEVHEKVTRIDIVAPGTIDELVLESLERKENLATNILAIRDRL